ncbi:hypothetical protein HPB52_018925 [Rhipicephalus sanguineus]|uniref:DDE Tnp4 domain-containing protein n=1 Tax=Rhipicephalus sanguineus TaxID=34632 RepID=A0A9D4T6K1_RHISA|nr:hypothetical protein HPB52_018925 [Rhipicephalus sanguineus]
MADHMRECYAISGFPQAIGALDGCHFVVSPPKKDAVDYYNCKEWYSVILLAVCGPPVPLGGSPGDGDVEVSEGEPAGTVLSVGVDGG